MICTYTGGEEIIVDSKNQLIKIPIIKNQIGIELCCLDSIFYHFNNNNNNNNNNCKIKFKINNSNKKDNVLQLCCINSFKKRKKIKSKIKLTIDPENFEIEIKDIPKIIKLFNFFKKTNLINTKEYFFGFLINYYFFLKGVE